MELWPLGFGGRGAGPRHFGVRLCDGRDVDLGVGGRAAIGGGDGRLWRPHGQIISAIKVRCGWHLSILWPFVSGSAIGIPIGTWLLPFLDPNRCKLVLGSLLVVCCSAMLATSRLPHINHGGRWADAVVGIAGGIRAAFVPLHFEQYLPSEIARCGRS